ncbi:hypothetical protein SAMD00023519_01546 [Listeria monocytogenes]|nr:hypothetical protein SAMD00023518_01089 [Listeria monocytogenes]GAT39363.1 hypothetical protein SAMD00023519_01546 [Listeria monocytogenes]
MARFSARSCSLFSASHFKVKIGCPSLFVPRIAIS